MRAELRNIQKKTGVTFIYITHDQGEALTMSDRIAVMNAGRIEQVGTADHIYSNPVSAFSASFVGEANQLAGLISAVDGNMAHIDTPHGRFLGQNPKGLSIGEDAILFVRPENVGFEPSKNMVSARVLRRDLEGPFVNLLMATTSGAEMAMYVPNTGEIEAMQGAELQIGFAPQKATILPVGPVARTGQDIAAQ
nr:TOBE domain-containing protein [Sulfitobacter sp. S223]